MQKPLCLRHKRNGTEVIPYVVAINWRGIAAACGQAALQGTDDFCTMAIISRDCVGRGDLTPPCAPTVAQPVEFYNGSKPLGKLLQ